MPVVRVICACVCRSSTEGVTVDCNGQLEVHRVSDIWSPGYKVTLTKAHPGLDSGDPKSHRSQFLCTINSNSLERRGVLQGGQLPLARSPVSIHGKPLDQNCPTVLKVLPDILLALDSGNLALRLLDLLLHSTVLTMRRI